MIRVLILGSRGFIGRNLAAALSGDRNVELTGFGRTSVTEETENLRFVLGDIDDSSALLRTLQDQDIVYHLISQTIPSSSWENPTLEIEKNLQPSLNLIELAASAGVKKICFSSSGGTVYGLNPEVLSESSATAPFSPYGIIKRTIESFLLYATHRFKINHDIYRISNAYGEGQDISGGLGFINTALENIINGRPVIVYGDGEVVRDFIYIKDVARILATSVSRNFDASDTFNVSANHPISLNDLLALIRRVVEMDFEVQYRPGRLNDNKKVVLDNAKIMDSSGNFTLVNLEDGVRNTYNFLKKRSAYGEKSI